MGDRTRATTKIVQTISGPNPQKILIKKKSDTAGPGFQIAKRISTGKPGEPQTAEETDEAKEDSELERRKAEYELAKNRIFETSSEAQTASTDPSQKQNKKKSVSTNEMYDPAFDRAKGANHILQQQMKVNTDNTLVDPNMGGYPMMFPQLGGPMNMNMNPYQNYPMMNPFPPLMMNQYQVGGPGNMVGGYPYPVAFPQNNGIINQSPKPNVPQKKGSKE